MTKIRLVHDPLFLSVKQMLRISTQVFKRSSCLHQYLVFHVFFTRYASIWIVGQPNRKANSKSWLMMIKRIPLSLYSLINFCILFILRASNPEVGSSNIKYSGCRIKPTAKMTLCFWPPDKKNGMLIFQLFQAEFLQ